MTAMALTISVVIPAYNAGALVAEAVKSALTQTYAPLEVVVVDDGSADDTARLASEAGARVISQQNAGVSAARNRGMAEARGQWIAFLDADDRWLPDRLAKQARALEYVPDAKFLFSDMRRERDGRVVEPRWMLDRAVYQATRRERIAENIVAFDGRELAFKTLEENFIPTSSVLLARDAAPVGGFVPQLKYCEDLEFWLRVFACGKAAAVEEPLIVYRLHSASASAHWEAILRGDIALYERICADPDAYPKGLARRAAELISPRGVTLGQHLVRSGKYAEAMKVLRRSFKETPSAQGAGWLALSLLLQAPGASKLHAALRARKNETA